MLPLESFFDEFEKIADVGSLASKILAKTIQHPGQALWRTQQLEEGMARHKATMNALRNKYPTGWVPLGMRPSE